MRHRLHSEDASRPGQLQSRYRQQPDRPGAEHHRGLTRLDSGEAERVKGDRQRFHQSGRFQPDVRGHGDQIMRRKIHRVLEESGNSAGTHEAHVLAEIGPVAPAHLANSAGQARFERKMVSGLNPGYRRPRSQHHTGRFVPQHHWETARRVADAPFREIVQI
jgi:hypothetical protein